MQNSEFRFQNSEFRIQNSEFKHREFGGEGRRNIPAGAFCLAGYAGVEAQLADHVVEALFGAGDFTRSLIDVQKTRSHRRRDLVQITDLAENILGQLA